jgi:predicted GNAT family acetyltransferase
MRNVAVRFSFNQVSAIQLRKLVGGGQTRMQIDLENVQVTHNPEENRFETWTDENLSKLDYIQDGKNFVITHVGVHPDLRGQGVAGKLVQVSLEYAREKSLRVIPMCSYAASYLRRHPEYAELTSQERSE